MPLPGILVLGRLRQEDREFEDSPSLQHTQTGKGWDGIINGASSFSQIPSVSVHRVVFGTWHSYQKLGCLYLSSLILTFPPAGKQAPLGLPLPQLLLLVTLLAPKASRPSQVIASLYLGRTFGVWNEPLQPLGNSQPSEQFPKTSPPALRPEIIIICLCSPLFPPSTQHS